MGKKFGWVVFFVSISWVTLEAQELSSWKTLANLIVQKDFDPNLGMEVLTPTFFPPVLELAGQEILIEGYMIPLSGRTQQSHFMFSAYPSNACFFCGAAGPESVMQVFMKNNEKVEVKEQKITLKGIFRINQDVATQMFYNLEQAEIVK